MRSRPVVTALLALIVGITGFGVRAETAEDCIDIQDRAARLECFDRVFPRRKTSGETPPADSTAEQPPVVATEPATSAPREAPNAEQPAAKRAERERRFGLPELGGIFGQRDSESVTSRVAAVHRRDKQKMVFLLDNDQIWIQVNPRDVAIDVGDLVTVSSTVMGGHMMRTDNGVSTRVNRIR